VIEAVPQPPALDDIITDLQRIIDANETTNLLVRQTSPQLSEALLLHLCDIDALVRTLQVKLSQLSRR
jgi:hypothetical protein